MKNEYSDEQAKLGKQWIDFCIENSSVILALAKDAEKAEEDLLAFEPKVEASVYTNQKDIVGIWNKQTEVFNALFSIWEKANSKLEQEKSFLKNQFVHCEFTRLNQRACEKILK